MDRRDFLTQSLRSLMAAGGASCLAGCGTILHSERVHQPHSRDIDWGMAALDGLGLALFFVPGVVAFAVDFYTGAIYLPYEAYGSAEQPPTEAVARRLPPPPERDYPPQKIAMLHEGGRTFRSIEVGAAELDQQVVEHAVGGYVGQAVQLADPAVRVSPLEHLERFAAVQAECERDPRFGLPSGKWLRRLFAA